MVGSQHNIGAVQALRGVAALMVVMLHLDVQLDRLGIDANGFSGLASGVDIFFVISGFIMWITTDSRPDRSPLDFLRDRVIRIGPLYWCITLLMSALLVVSPDLLQSAEFDSVHVLSSFLFIPWPSPVDGSYVPLLIPGWTLNYEMFFYLIFAIALALAMTSLKQRAAIILGSLILIVGAGRLLPTTGLSRFYVHDIILEFGFGIVVAILYRNGKYWQSRWWLSLVAIGFTLIAMMSAVDIALPRSIAWGLPSTIILAGAVFAKPYSIPAIEKLGLWSYALYLTHPLVLSACGQGWRLVGGSLPSLLFPWVAVLACILAAAMTYRLVEMPLTQAFKGRVNGSRHLAARQTP